MRKAVDVFMTVGNTALMVLGFWYEVWEFSILAGANAFLYFGVPSIIHRISNATRRKE